MADHLCTLLNLLPAGIAELQMKDGDLADDESGFFWVYIVK